MLSQPDLDRSALVDRYLANRARTAQLFSSLDASIYEHAPIPLRHPFVFYDGHIPAFSFTVLHRRALGGASIDDRLEKLFERGIDPADLAAAAQRRIASWPTRDAVRAFASACDDAVIADLLHAKLDDPTRPLLVRAEAAWNILEHEEMHHETLAYIINRLSPILKRAPATDDRDEMPAQRAPVAIPAGRVTLGVDRSAIPFGWDNEFDATSVDVTAFGLDVFNVTNGDYLAFVRDGATPPSFWFERDGAWWLHTLYGELPLPLSWPVYASHDEAASFAHWAGARLPSEAEYQRAAYGTREGTERTQPWGDAAPDASRGNFDWRRGDPEPVGSSPAGASAFGIEDLVGNGWEWTSTPFAPLPGFAPMASYPQYSADFFDNKHFVMKGASPVTSRHLVRRSFRNWFYGDYPYMFATFRRAYD